MKNWAGNLSFGASSWHTPSSIEALQELVHATPKIRAVGTRHSFNEVANSQHALVSMERLNQVVSLDRENLTVTVEAGIRYGELSQYLNRHGFALHNLASLVHIGVAGACATATHGSGIHNGCLSTAVASLDILKPNGESVRLSREKDPEMFNGTVVGLGALGIITRLTLDIEPAFQVQQQIYEELPFAEMASHFEEIMSAAYSVSLFTDWAGETVNQVWLKHRMNDQQLRTFPADFFGALPAKEKVHPVAGFSAESCTDQMGVPGDWHERIQHFRLDFTPSAGDELQSEFLLPLESAIPALNAIKSLGPKISPLLYTSEIRTVAADDLWLSMAYGRPSVCIHFTWKSDWGGVKPVLKEIENRLRTFDARPHWGKISMLSPSYIRAQYPKFEQFLALKNSVDPSRKFENAFLNDLLADL